MTLVNHLTTRFLSVLVIVFIFNSCVREDEDLAAKVNIIAHRGYHMLQLENTTESFQAAVKKNFKHLEFDISFTKDYQPVILHDYLLDEQSDTTGAIGDFYFSDVNLINLSGGYKIPSFDTVMQKFGTSFETFFIDLKEPCPDSGLINFAKVIEKNHAYATTIITSANPDVIRRLKNLDPALIVGSDDASGDFEDNLDECIKQKYKHLLISFELLDKHLCFIAHANGIKVYAYTPNSEQDMLKCLSFDIDGIMSDNPDLLKQLLY
ncbi:MAG: hypothetical protein COT22_03780 [Ignavibacteria bacterium CG08_land_8_20_14_0_20_37_9]|nr:MAG: hypothetical protein COT22_03780 [Ignavibacteria bacterium CG08_land_8_20_14_0_20_37_9]PIX95225.1 MAG: hypothetical protein COZ25_01545 [Ignavibacteria bacterium CG_4_10_14_3_um_filter_37_18]